jgi:hypothetical protein
LNTGGGLLTFVGAVYDFNGSFDNPWASGCVVCGDNPVSQFDAGTFVFQAATSATPLPAALPLFGSALFGLVALGRRQTKTKQL